MVVLAVKPNNVTLTGLQNKNRIYPKRFHKNTRKYFTVQCHENSIRHISLNGYKRRRTHNFVRWNILMRYINNWRKFITKNILEKNKLKLFKHELNELEEMKHLKDLIEIKKNIIKFHIYELNELESKLSQSKINFRMNYPNPKI
jgi:hypothetical protein